jgi:hypothetical protein
MMRTSLLVAIAVSVGCSSPPPATDSVDTDPGAAVPADVTETTMDSPQHASPPASVPDPPSAPAALPASPTRGAGTLPSAPAEPGIRGRINASGTDHEPITTLQVEGRMALIVTGPLEPELRSLAGAIVVVRGAESGTARRTIHVESYEIVEIDGARPFVGVVLSGDRLAAGADTLILVGAPEGMRTGGRVWITGERTGTQLRVSSWGAIGGGTP